MPTAAGAAPTATPAPVGTPTEAPVEAKVEVLKTGFYRLTPDLLCFWALVRNSGSSAGFFREDQSQIPGIDDPDTVLTANVNDTNGFLLGQILFDWAQPQVVEPGETTAFVVSVPYDWKPASLVLGTMPAFLSVKTGSLSATVSDVKVGGSHLTGVATNNTGHDLSLTVLSVIGLDSSGRVAATGYSPTSLPYTFPAGAKIHLDGTIVPFGKPVTFKVYVSAQFFGDAPSP